MAWKRGPVFEASSMILYLPSSPPPIYLCYLTVFHYTVSIQSCTVMSMGERCGMQNIVHRGDTTAVNTSSTSRARIWHLSTSVICFTALEDHMLTTALLSSASRYSTLKCCPAPFFALHGGVLATLAITSCRLCRAMFYCVSLVGSGVMAIPQYFYSLLHSSLLVELYTQT